MTNLSAAERTTSKPLTPPLSVTSKLLKRWYHANQAQGTNSVVFSKPSKKAGSSVPAPGSRLEAEFALLLRAHKLPEPIREYRILRDRMYRWDFCWPEQKVAVEIQGGRWVKSGHSSGTGIERDARKNNLAQLQGWLCMVFVDEHLRDGSALAWTKQALGL